MVTVLHRSYYVQDLSIENKKAGNQKHVVVSRKQQIIGVDGVLDPEDLTNSAKCLSLQPTREDN